MFYLTTHSTHFIYGYLLALLLVQLQPLHELGQQRQAERERERDIRVIYISLSDTKWSIYLFLYFSVLKLLFIQLGTITKTLIQLTMMRSKYKMRLYIKNKCHFTNEQSVYNPLPSTGSIRLFLITMHHTE